MSSTSPENLALTGPTFATTDAEKFVSEALVNVSQPGIHCCNIVGSLRAAQTCSLSAFKLYFPMSSKTLIPLVYHLTITENPLKISNLLDQANLNSKTNSKRPDIQAILDPKAGVLDRIPSLFPNCFALFITSEIIPIAPSHTTRYPVLRYLLE